MTFLAGILQPPFFDPKANMMANYAGIGMVIGHEITHAFDDQGRQYDANGSLRDWWSEKTEAEFKKKGECLAKQFDQYPTAGGGHVNGKLVLGEAIGDQGGLKLAFNAWIKTLPEKTQSDKESLKIEKQKFFLSYAQAWCGKDTDAFEQLRVNRDPHPPNRYRVNSTLVNFPAFAETYSCSSNAKMAPTNKCIVW